ncbi:MAG: hypothetical protein EHM61_03945 [Acidobacteria bacterium]|nr:MAG: hypothetical protein EHM61_03945 [Acidobacteriota bacterium]
MRAASTHLIPCLGYGSDALRKKRGACGSVSLALGVFLLFSRTVCAGVNAWTSVGPEQAVIDSLSSCQSDPSTVFAISGRHVYRSTDKANSWERVPGLAHEYDADLAKIICHPADPRRVYAALNGVLQRSTDKGDTWSVVTRNVYHPSTDPRNPEILYAVRDYAFQRSTDGGFTWTLLLADSSASTSLVDPGLPSVIYLLTFDGLLKSADSGRHWSKTGLGVAPEIVLVDPADSKRLFAAGSGTLFGSTDGGETWTQLLFGPPKYPGGPPPFPGIRAISVKPGHPEVVYLGTYGGLYKSTDAGQTWAATAFRRPITALAFLSGDSEALTAATSTGVFKIAGDESKWVERNSGLRGGAFNCLLSHPIETQTLYATQGAWFFASTNGGRNWVERSTGIDPNAILRTLRVDPKNPSIIYLGTDKHGIYKTTDLGLTWIRAAQGITTPGVRDLVVDPKHPNILYASGYKPTYPLFRSEPMAEPGEDVYRSTDGGASWSLVNIGLPVIAYSLAIDPVNTATLYAASWRGLYKSTDSGVNWNNVLTSSSNDRIPALQVLVDSTHAQNVYAVAQSGFYRSDDAGANWAFYPYLNIYNSIYNFGVLTLIRIDPRHSEVLYLGTTAGLLKSTDSGRSWKPLYERGSIDPYLTYLPVPYAVHVSETGTVYASGLNLGILTYTAADSLFVPRLVNQPGGEMTGLALSNHGSGEATATVKALDESGSLIQGSGITNPVEVVLPPGQQRSWLAHDLFGAAFRETAVKGWLRIDGTSAENVTGFFSLLTPNLSVFDTASANDLPSSVRLFSELGAPRRGELWLANPNDSEAKVRLELRDQDGTVKSLLTRRIIPSGGLLAERFHEIFDSQISAGDSVWVMSDQPLAGLECLTDGEDYAAVVGGLDSESAAGVLFAPQYAIGPGISTNLTIVNVDSEPGTVTIQLYADDGRPVGSERTVTIGGRGKIAISDPGFFGLADGQAFSGYVRIHSPWVRLAGSVVFADPESKRFSASLPLIGAAANTVFFSHLVSTAEYFTGLAVLNGGMEGAQVTIEVLRADGSRLAEKQVRLEPGARLSSLLTEFFPELVGQSLAAGAIRIQSDQPIAAFALFGDYGLKSLSALPGQ